MHPDQPAALTGHAAYLSVLMGQRAQARFAAAMAGLGLRPRHYDVLVTLAASGAIAQKQLADLLEVDAARVVALTDVLEGRGLVVRSVDPRDRRRNLLALTKDGRATAAKAQRLAAAVDRDLLRALDEPEREELRSLLRKALSAD